MNNWSYRLKQLAEWLRAIGQNKDKPICLRQKALEELLGEKLGNLELYRQALTHRSYEGVGKMRSNERLEYLGDSVVSLAVGDALFRLYPEETEGVLTNIRSFLVSRKNMNATAEKMGIEPLIYADGGLSLEGSDIPGNTLEALVGAIYLDKGYDFAAKFVRNHLIVSKKNVRVVAKKEEDYKTELIIMMQREKVPYQFQHLDSNFDKEQGFVHRCRLIIEFPNGTMKTVGVGNTKKQSHQNAAKEALRRIHKIREQK